MTPLIPRKSSTLCTRRRLQIPQSCRGLRLLALHCLPTPARISACPLKLSGKFSPPTASISSVHSSEMRASQPSANHSNTCVSMGFRCELSLQRTAGALRSRRSMLSSTSSGPRSRWPMRQPTHDFTQRPGCSGAIRVSIPPTSVVPTFPTLPSSTASSGMSALPDPRRLRY